jgi:hypothetical protein
VPVGGKSSGRQRRLCACVGNSSGGATRAQTPPDFIRATSVSLRGWPSQPEKERANAEEKEKEKEKEEEEEGVTLSGRQCQVGAVQPR